MDYIFLLCSLGYDFLVFFTGEPVAHPADSQKSVCVITGLPAKYDPFNYKVLLLLFLITQSWILIACSEFP